MTEPVQPPHRYGTIAVSVLITDKSINQLESIMDILRMDIALDLFVDKMGEEAAKALKDGQDVTKVFADDIARPVKAVVIDAEGPGGGNPYVELTFMDEDHSWEWFKENMGTGDCDADIDEYEIAQVYAA